MAGQLFPWHISLPLLCGSRCHGRTPVWMKAGIRTTNPSTPKQVHLNPYFGFCICCSLSEWQPTSSTSVCWPCGLEFVLCHHNQHSTHVQTSALWEEKKKEKQETLEREILTCSVRRLPFLFPPLRAAPPCMKASSYIIWISIIHGPCAIKAN